MALSCSAVCASPSASTSLIASEAPERPSSSASAWPMPEPAPVTAATFPANPSISAYRGDRRLQPPGELGLPPRGGGSCRCPVLVFLPGSDWSFVQRRETHRREESEAE